ncbi:TPA: hypothetical protein ACQTXP_004094 [Pseudomonas aeruginosa]|nr:hypothetical protein [Pseudomonas aeruginosa]
MDNENETLIAQALVGALFLFGLFWIVGSAPERITERTGVEQMEQELKPCPYCRGYDLERRWCHVCNGRGVVDVKAQQRERAEIVKALREAGIEVRD